MTISVSATIETARARASVRGHRIFLAVLAAGVLLRVIAMLGYRPGFLYYGDSYSYLDSALRLRPNWGLQPSGYGLLLWLLKPLHSLAAVVAVQHLLGLGVGVLVYALLRRRFGLPGWAAALAAAPPLLDPYLLELEQSILSDTLFIFLVTAAVTAALWDDAPRYGAAAGLLLAGASITRTVGLPLLGLLLIFLLARRADWRTVAAALVAAALPLLVYAGWYASYYGRFSLATGDGIALWARTASFADCGSFRPDEPRLCPDGMRPHDAASEYVWADDAPVRNLPGGFGGQNSAARHFALQAIADRPGAYATAVARDVSLAFHWDRAPHPARVLPAYEFGTADLPLHPRPGAAATIRAYDPGTRHVDAVQPYAGLLRSYQDAARLPGPVLAGVLVLGVAGRRRRAALLPWTGAVALLVLPVAALDFDHRYVLPAIPPACIAAGIALARRDRDGIRTPGVRKPGVRTPGGGRLDTLDVCPRLAGTS